MSAQLREEFRAIADKTVAIASYEDPICIGVTLATLGNYLGFAMQAESFLNLLREIENQEVLLERIGTEEEWVKWLHAYHSLAMRLLLHVWQIASHIAKIKGEEQPQEDPNASKAGLFFAPPSVDGMSWGEVTSSLTNKTNDFNLTQYEPDKKTRVAKSCTLAPHQLPHRVLTATQRHMNPTPMWEREDAVSPAEDA